MKIEMLVGQLTTIGVVDERAMISHPAREAIIM